MGTKSPRCAYSRRRLTFRPIFTRNHARAHAYASRPFLPQCPFLPFPFTPL